MLTIDDIIRPKFKVDTKYSDVILGHANKAVALQIEEYKTIIRSTVDWNCFDCKRPLQILVQSTKPKAKDMFCERCLPHGKIEHGIAMIKYLDSFFTKLKLILIEKSPLNLTKPMRILKIGLDQSITNTGVVVREYVDGEHQKPHYYLISDSKSKCPQQARPVIYKRLFDDDTTTYSQSENNKITSAYNFAQMLLKIVNLHKKDCDRIEVAMEAPIMANSRFQNQGRINDLLILSSITRLSLMSIGCKISMIAPQSLKKHFLGEKNRKAKKGEDSKQIMIDHFKLLEPNFELVGKYDDIIDAYALSTINHNEWLQNENPVKKKKKTKKSKNKTTRSKTIDGLGARSKTISGL